MSNHVQTRILEYATFAVGFLGALASMAIAGFETYVRWYLNQNYTVLGEGTLGMLIIASFGVLLGLTWIRLRN